MCIFRKSKYTTLTPFVKKMGLCPVKNQTAHLPTRSKQHTLDTHCKPSSDSKFLEPPLLATMVDSNCLQSISMLDLQKLQTLIHNKLYSIVTLSDDSKTPLITVLPHYLLCNIMYIQYIPSPVSGLSRCYSEDLLIGTLLADLHNLSFQYFEKDGPASCC